MLELLGCNSGSLEVDAFDGQSFLLCSEECDGLTLSCGVVLATLTKFSVEFFLAEGVELNYAARHVESGVSQTCGWGCCHVIRDACHYGY